MWPERIKLHGPWVVGLWVVVALLWLWFAWDKLKANHGQNGGLEARDLNVPVHPHTQISPTISPIFAPVFNTQSAPAINPALQRHEERESIAPHLSIVRAQIMMLECSGQMIKQAQTGSLGMVLWVENPEAAEGSQAREVQGDAAVIRFSSDRGLFGRVERAFWLGHWENNIDIQVGESKALVVGIQDGIAWRYYSNSRKTRPPSRPTAQQLRNMATTLSIPLEPTHILLNPALDAEISVISVRTGHTLLRCGYRIIKSFDNASFEIEKTS